ncbi:MAG: alpha-1,2-fucosyltransferase [Chitinophagaceae bacterium]|nr:MAG: alpha-1,2-fucosyltransferase [Chitinophagaceae bacterium]
MIAIQLKGGLGNQLFQYAAARTLAIRQHTEVLLDTSHYREDQLRDFDLFHLNVKARIATASQIDEIRPTGTVGRALSHIAPYRFKRIYQQPFYHYDAGFVRLRGPVYLKGYFQSEAYFRPVAAEIRRELTFRELPLPQIQALGARLRQEQSVSLHIRRGDYKNPETLRVHGILPLEYYRAAVKRITDSRPDARFYVFTDDLEWVRQHLAMPEAMLVSGEITKTHFEDLYLMQHCRNHILANSSFSWWGAWLNPDKEKIVVAPKAWFNEGPKDTQDLIPRSWIRL